MKIVHIITGLNVGGAEVMLRSLLQHSDRAAFESEVISLTDIGSVGRDIAALGVPVRAMQMRRGVPEPGGLMRLIRQLRQMRPDVVQTWLYHADLIGGLAARLAGIRALAWGLHISHLDAPSSKKSTLWTVKMGARLSHRLPARIVCCAHSAQRLHTEIGYAADKMTVIPNGFDGHSLRPDEAARRATRAELELDDATPLIGLVGRFHPQKDHHNFIRAAALLHARRPDAHFLLCGEGSEWSNATLRAWIDEAKLRERFHLIGRRDTAPLYPALDVLSLSSSYGEAFPMVVGEAMSCGVPCVVTDVGDSALLVGAMGRVVAPRDAAALSAAWLELLEMPQAERQALGQQARGHIAAHYSIDAVAARYAALYQELASE